MLAKHDDNLIFLVIGSRTVRLLLIDGFFAAGTQISHVAASLKLSLVLLLSLLQILLYQCERVVNDVLNVAEVADHAGEGRLDLALL